MREPRDSGIAAVRGGKADFSGVQGGVRSTEQIVKKPQWHDFLPGMAFKARRWESGPGRVVIGGR
ncbi:MAG TPA: hypothetical protein VFF91_06360 [Pseudoxanthomonas sp.]|nr:hypothetical protein [Pseudoxanthomonas sp.]